MTALLEPGGRVQQPVRLRARRAPSERVLTEQRLLHRIGARVRDDSLLLSRSKGLRGGGSAQGTTLRPSSLCSFRPRPAVAVVPVADAVANVREHGLKPIFRRLIPALSHAVRQRLETGHASLGLIGFGFVVAIEGVAKGARSDDERSSRGSDGRADPRVTQDPREGRCAGGNPSERRHGREGEVSHTEEEQEPVHPAPVSAWPPAPDWPQFDGFVSKLELEPRGRPLWRARRPHQAAKRPSVLVRVESIPTTRRYLHARAVGGSALGTLGTSI